MDSERLLIERARQGLSRQELAKRSGVNAHTVSEMERGVRNPRATTVAKIAEALGLTPEELLGKAPSSSPKAPEAQDDEERRGLSMQEASKHPLVVFELPGLKTARERRDVSINELSFRTGLQATAISDLESGNRVPDEDTVSLLARALDDCPHAELIFPPERFNADTFSRSNEEELTYADQLVTPGGRKLSQAINENAERRAREQPEAG